MMLLQIIDDDLKKAMKAKDTVRVSCLRMLKASFKNLQVAKGGELSDDEVRGTISSTIRKSKEAIEEFRKAGREDLAQKEDLEIRVLFEYLPEQLTSEQIESTVREVIIELSAKSFKDLGRVMKTAMARMEGKVQGKDVNEIAKRLLS